MARPRITTARGGGVVLVMSGHPVAGLYGLTLSFFDPLSISVRIKYLF